MDGNLEEFRELLDGFEIALLTTRDAQGRYHTRPMELQRHDEDGSLWFATSLDSRKIADLRSDPRCAVAFLESHAYMSISGRAELVKDEALVRELWSPAWRGWFPEGPDEPDLVLLRIVPEHVEWVRPEGGRAKAFYTMVKNAVTRSHDEPAPRRELDPR